MSTKLRDLDRTIHQVALELIGRDDITVEHLLDAYEAAGVRTVSDIFTLNEEQLATINKYLRELQTQ